LHLHGVGDDADFLIYAADLQRYVDLQLVIYLDYDIGCGEFRNPALLAVTW